MLFSGEYVLVTGSNRGIGNSILHDFVENGANAFAHARVKTNEFEQFCKGLEEKYERQVIPVYCDLQNPDEIRKVVQKIQSYKRDLSILVNNAGVVNSVKLFQMTSINEIQIDDQKKKREYCKYCFMCGLRWRYRYAGICKQ